MTETTGTLADFDRDFDAKTLALATAPNQAAIIAALGPDAERYASDTESLYAFAFGHMRERARVTLERLRAAEARVAELEAERELPKWPCCEHCNHFDPGSGHSAECGTCRSERFLDA